MSNPNRPKKGSSIKVGPIKERSAIDRIKRNLANWPRDLCLLQFGLNTGFRANELLSIKFGQVRHLKMGEDFELKLSKTRSYRRVTVNQAVVNAVRDYLTAVPLSDTDWLFPSSKTGKPLTVSTVSTYVKKWCQDAGLAGNYASHTLRKSWGFWQRVANDVPIPILMVAFGHSTQQQTLSYLGIQDKEIAQIYLNLEL